MNKVLILMVVLVMSLAACNLDDTVTPTAPPSGGNNDNGGGNIEGERGVVTNVVDGDTIDVEIDGQEYRVRYVGVNTPERDEPCYSDATAANRALVGGQTVTLVQDVSNTDRYDRLLRYVYVGDTFVNQQLVAQGFAEAVLYEPDDREHANFVQIEQQAESQNLGCHPTGIFDDSSTTR